jgi:hypothetical protein
MATMSNTLLEQLTKFDPDQPLEQARTRSEWRGKKHGARKSSTAGTVNAWAPGETRNRESASCLVSRDEIRGPDLGSLGCVGEDLRHPTPVFVSVRALILLRNSAN